MCFGCVLMLLSLCHRYFESGVFRGFFKSHGTALFTPLLEPLNVENVYYIAICSDWDIETCLNDQISGNSGIFNLVSCS